ncbi:LexA family protein [Sphingomonas montanisoli]|uniref:LexA repressor DNA-binding domain-containing protein n=1 Tax=Sphingomonas montanisoli TaxID=2606412 RepID=A0A5D9C1G7_9SPHN|nr:hypothetical protein [Sphingomonas montanisoli]TZG24890.1 hypothetical protein FYJ91_16550 [Sphingomonas montanisoli]
MTRREAKALSFIRDYQRAHHGASPSLTEIATDLGLKSRSNAHTVVDHLIAEGRLRRSAGSHRALVIVEAQPDLTDVATDALIAELDKRLPFGSVQFAFDPVHANRATIEGRA